MQCDVQLINRLKRAQGQMQGVLKMMNEDASCEDLLTQLKAIRSSIEKAIGLLTTHNLVQTIEAQHQIKLEDIEEAIALIVKGI